MTAYWFKPKRYGYGATPVSWQGWTLTGIAMVLVLGAAMLVAAFGRTTSGAWLALIAFEAAVIAILWMVARRTTEGDWRWRWGGADDRG